VQLCWQTFVDDPGHEIGIGRLVHISQPAELSDLVQPEAVPMPQSGLQQLNINIPFVGKDTDDNGIAYTKGAETEVGFGDSEEHIEWRFPQSATFNKPGYTLSRVELDPQGADAQLSCTDLLSTGGTSTGTFTIQLDYVDFHDQTSISVIANLVWVPGIDLESAAAAEDAKRIASFSAEKERRFREAYLAAARERIKLASTIQPRRAEDLREEERTVVYRALISQLMRVGASQSKHVISELVRSIFDVDKMLYFVAPEWWRTRLHRSAQVLGDASAIGSVKSASSAAMSSALAFGGVKFAQPLSMALAGSQLLPSGAGAAAIPAEDLVDWGGGREAGRDNYYITEESAPAKLGSSLGWLLQLDGDDLRNAFLNSPWVKAVIPIRLGKERAAINWLQQAQVEGTDGLDAEYVASADDPAELRGAPGHPVSVRAALDYLIDKINEFDRKARTPVTPNPVDPEDPRNHFAGSLPAETVFEHGFYPLRGGVRCDQDGTEPVIFSQWIEILPTDQIAALQVEYDPKTLQVRVTDSPADTGEAVPVVC
jgi:hypothetical protein